MRIPVWVAPSVALTSAAAQTPRAEFDAASIKPSAPRPQRTPQMLQLLAGMHDLMPPGMFPMSPGRVNFREEPLRQIAASAWSVRAGQVSGPKWMAEDLFDVEATFPPETPRDRVHDMLQALLTGRFGIKLHRERVTAKGYALLIAKDGPKLNEAVLVKPGGADGPPPITKPPGPMAPGAQRSAYQNVTTETLAAILSRTVEEPVVDMTGLTGRYDVMLETSRDTAESSGPTIFDAVRDLGLRLEPGRVQLEMLVIDEIRRAPAPN